jgi:hypothetical protein
MHDRAVDILLRQWMRRGPDRGVCDKQEQAQQRSSGNEAGALVPRQELPDSRSVGWPASGLPRVPCKRRVVTCACLLEAV